MLILKKVHLKKQQQKNDVILMSVFFTLVEGRQTFAYIHTVGWINGAIKCLEHIKVLLDEPLKSTRPLPALSCSKCDAPELQWCPDEPDTLD